MNYLKLCPVVLEWILVASGPAAVGLILSSGAVGAAIAKEFHRHDLAGAGAGKEPAAPVIILRLTLDHRGHCQEEAASQPHGSNTQGHTINRQQ